MPCLSVRCQYAEYQWRGNAVVVVGRAGESDATIFALSSSVIGGVGGQGGRGGVGGFGGGGGGAIELRPRGRLELPITVDVRGANGSVGAGRLLGGNGGIGQPFEEGEAGEAIPLAGNGGDGEHYKDPQAGAPTASSAAF